MRPPTTEFLKGSREATRLIFHLFFGSIDAWIAQGEFHAKFRINGPESTWRSLFVHVPMDTPLSQICEIMEEARRSAQAIENFHKLFSESKSP